MGFARGDGGDDRAARPRGRRHRRGRCGCPSRCPASAGGSARTPPALLDAGARAGRAALPALRRLRRLRAAARRGRLPRARGRRETIVRALAAQGLEAEVRPTLTSPPRSRRRAVFAGRRTPQGRAASASTPGGPTPSSPSPAAGCCGRRSSRRTPALAALTALAASRLAAVRLTVTAGPAGLDVDVAGGRAARRRARGASWRPWRRRPTSRGSPGTASRWRPRRPPLPADGRAPGSSRRRAPSSRRRPRARRRWSRRSREAAAGARAGRRPLLPAAAPSPAAGRPRRGARRRGRPRRWSRPSPPAGAATPGLRRVVARPATSSAGRSSPASSPASTRW